MTIWRNLNKLIYSLSGCKKYKCIIIAPLFMLVLFFGQYILSSEKQGADNFGYDAPHSHIPSADLPLSDKAGCLVLNYWKDFNYADTAIIMNTEYIEQVFVDFIDFFQYAPLNMVSESICNNLQDAMFGSPEMFGCFSELYEKYLYDPNSRMRDEDIYIVVLKHILEMDNINSLQTLRFKSQLDMVMKNRHGNIAADFELIKPDKKKIRLHSIPADYTILFFNDPDCPDCLRVKEILKRSGIVKNFMSENHQSRLSICAVYTDEDMDLWRKTEYPDNWVNGYSQAIRKARLYDVRAMPTLYLLDKNKRVILKDADVELILEYLDENKFGFKDELCLR